MQLGRIMQSTLGRVHGSRLVRPFAGLAAAPARARQLSGVAARAMSIAEHSAYLEEVAVTGCPKHLPELLKVFEAQGFRLVSPSDRTGLHPLVIPLAAAPASALPGAAAAAAAAAPPGPDAALAGDEVVVGLLRWPQPRQHGAMALPLVAQSRQAKGVKLLARSVEEQLHRLLVEEDAAGGSGPLAAAAGPGAAEVYKAGALAAVGMAGKLNLYLLRKVGMFPDVCESLARGHLARGDVTSALVAAEWYMRNNHFQGWGRPYEFAAAMYSQLGKRDEEARDMARFALRNPWWSLQDYGAMEGMCAIEGGPKAVKYALSEEAAAAASGKVNKFDYREPKTEQQLALEAAADLLDFVAAGQAAGGYEAAAAQLAEHYRSAGLADVANFLSASQ